ncbi:MAG: hypothetical protein HZA20_01925 [Nitrospirae bacterium]|nr:hypothetical protein [Nitrospirota bacterium]
MTDERVNALRTGRNIGAAIGGIIFLAFGIVPAFHFGSAGMLILLTHLSGGPVDPGIIVRMFLVVGVIMGLVCVSAVSVVVGSVLGTTLAWITDTVSEALRPAPEKAAQAAAKK